MPRSKKTEEEKKYDLTINVNVNLLNKVDSIIEKNGDKRSRLIERLLIEYVENNKNKL
jgi:metal-responsive CopG/Arc/MetJ family transcriptional regulator